LQSRICFNVKLVLDLASGSFFPCILEFEMVRNQIYSLFLDIVLS
jgi:hypothetical protein